MVSVPIKTEVSSVSEITLGLILTFALPGPKRVPEAVKKQNGDPGKYE